MNTFETIAVLFYVAATLSSLVGFCLFVWWWHRKKGATAVYTYITLLFGAQAFEQGVEGIVYYLYAIDHPTRSIILGSAVWPIRTLFVALVMTAIVIHISNRIIVQRRRAKMFQARKQAKPDEFYRQEILVVDDHIEVLELVSNTINRAFPNITVYKARTAEESLHVFTEHKHISLVITDLLLPRMNGFELCALIKEECPWTIIIGMTGYTSIYEFWTAREIGFDDYVQKPFHIADIVDVVRKHLEVLERWKGIRVGRSKPKNRRRRKTDERENVDDVDSRTVCHSHSGEPEDVR